MSRATPARECPTASTKANKSVRMEKAQGGYVVNKTTEGRNYHTDTAIAKTMGEAMRHVKEHLGGEAPKVRVPRKK